MHKSLNTKLVIIFKVTFEKVNKEFEVQLKLQKHILILKNLLKNFLKILYRRKYSQ